MKKITTVLFDLDGTLIRMDQDEFIRLYFETVLDKLEGLGYDRSIMGEALEIAIVATLKNNGEMTNEERFWLTLKGKIGGLADKVRGQILSYYSEEFIDVIGATCSPYSGVREVLDLVRERGLRPVLATNPLFPIAATYARIELGGMSKSDFEYVSAYENSSYCKPNPDYLRELLSKLSVTPEECAMIGNDTRDDFCAEELGIPVFVLTECLINKRGVDLSSYPHGGFGELIEYIKGL